MVQSVEPSEVRFSYVRMIYVHSSSTSLFPVLLLKCRFRVVWADVRVMVSEVREFGMEKSEISANAGTSSEGQGGPSFGWVGGSLVVVGIRRTTSTSPLDSSSLDLFSLSPHRRYSPCSRQEYHAQSISTPP